MTKRMLKKLVILFMPFALILLQGCDAQQIIPLITQAAQTLLADQNFQVNQPNQAPQAATATGDNETATADAPPESFTAVGDTATGNAGDAPENFTAVGRLVSNTPASGVNSMLGELD